jgi:hypothetical protein
VAETPELIDDFRLGTAYPNPFNGAVTIPVENPGGQQLSLRIYDLQGREVFHKKIVQRSGEQFVWQTLDLQGHPVNSGVYLVSLASARSQLTRKIMLLK